MVEFLPPIAQRVLVLSPHPDDEALGCSGTISLYSEKNVDVSLVVISKGDKLESASEDISEIRRAETETAAALLGIKETIFLEFPDEEIDSHQEELKEKLANIISDLNPQIIFAPFPLDPHPDHRAVSRVALRVMAGFPGIRLAFYEIYHPIRFNTLVDISSVINKKEDAVLAYRKSLLGIPELFWFVIKGLNSFRSLARRQEGIFEAFYLIDAPLSMDQVVKWATFDYSYAETAEVFLSQVKIVDTLLFELQGAHGALNSKEAELFALKAVLNSKETEFSALKAAVEEGEKRLNEKDKEPNRFDLIENSFVWKIATRFYEFRDRALPIGTRRRSLYNKATGAIKELIS